MAEEEEEKEEEEEEKEEKEEVEEKETGEVVIWRLVAGPCGAAMGIAATPSPTKPCSSIAAQLQTRCTLPCDPQLLQVHPAHHLLLTPPPLPASPPAMSSSGRCRQLSQCVGGRPQYSQCRPQ